MGRLTFYQYKGGYSFGRNVAGHIAVAEKALGKPLPIGSVVHHVDENPQNNEPTNLVVCPSEAYHKLLHRRARAYDACGNANWQLCQYCGKWDDPKNMQSASKSDRPSITYYHGTCRSSYRQAFKAEKGYKI